MSNVFTLFLLSLFFAAQVFSVQVDNSRDNLSAGVSTPVPTTNGALVCGGRTEADCEMNTNCTKLYGVYLTGAKASQSAYLVCGQKGVCPAGQNITGISKCVERTNLPKGDTFQVTGQFLCNLYAGVVEATCPNDTATDDRQQLAGKIINQAGCVLSQLDTFVFPPFTNSNNQRVQKVVYLFEVRPSPNATAASSPSFTITQLSFYVNLNDKTEVSNAIGFSQGSFNSTMETEEITGTPELFNALPKDGVRFFGLTTYQPAGEIEADIEPSYNCSTVPSDSAPQSYQSIDLILTLQADTDFFNQTMFAEAVAEVLNVSSSMVVFKSQTWVKRVVQESQVTITLNGPSAANHVSHFIYLFASEDPILAENGIQMTSVSYAANTPSSDDDSGLSKAAIAGIIIACIVGAIVLVGVIILIAKSSSSERRPNDAKTQMLY